MVLNIEPAIYIDSRRGEWGTVRLPCSQHVLRQYWNTSPIAPEQVVETQAHIARETANATFPLLRQLPLQKQALSSLTGKLALAAASTSSGEAVVHFVYNGLPIDSRSLRPEQRAVRGFSGHMLHEVRRDQGGEERLRAQLEGACAQASGGVAQTPADLRRGTWLSFMMNGVPALSASGWDIIVDERFPGASSSPRSWYGDLQPQHDREREWFDLRLGVVVDGHAANLLPALVDYLQATLGGDSANHRNRGRIVLPGGRALFLHLGDGRYVPVGIDRVERIAQTLVELFDRDALDEQHALRLPRHQASRLAQLECRNGPAVGR